MNNQKAKHTPGPWYTRYNQISSLTSSHGCTIANCNATQKGITDEEAEANAALISAAPDMLETLEAVLDWWTHTPGFENGEDDMPAEIFDGIRNAINKAKGY